MMKKSISFLLMLAVLMLAVLILALPTPFTFFSACAESSQGESLHAESLFTWNGYSVRLLNYSIRKTENTTANMRIYAEVVNETDRTLSLWFKDPTIDGVPVVAVGILGVEPHTTTSEKYFYVFAAGDDIDKDAASTVISDPWVLRGILELRDSETKETLYTEPVKIDISTLKGERNISTPRPTNTPKPTAMPTPRPTTKSDATCYTRLSKGSKGAAVKALQQRLIELGYMSGKADGSYGNKTNVAVREFCAQNYLLIESAASPEMQELLFSSRARPYSEPYIPLEISSNCQWKKTRTGMTSFRVQVINNSKTRTVRGFELEYYVTDVWGTRLLGDKITRRFTTTKTIKPGKTAYTMWAAIGISNYNIDSIHTSITKIVFDDGEIRDDFDPIDYGFRLH